MPAPYADFTSETYTRSDGHRYKTFTKENLGRAHWFLLHARSTFFPTCPNKELVNKEKLFLQTMFRTYPCTECRDDAKILLSMKPIDFTSRESYIEWMVDFHDMVTRKVKLNQEIAKREEKEEESNDKIEPSIMFSMDPDNVRLDWKSTLDGKSAIFTKERRECCLLYVLFSHPVYSYPYHPSPLDKRNMKEFMDMVISDTVGLPVDIDEKHMASPETLCVFLKEFVLDSLISDSSPNRIYVDT